MDVLLKKLAKALGLPETADEATVMAKAAEIRAAATAGSEIVGAVCGALKLAEGTKPADAAKAVEDLATASRQALDLPDTAAADDLVKALAARKETKPADDPDQAKFVTVEEHDKLAKAFAELSADRTGEKADDAVAAAKAAGKIPPALEDWAKSLAKRDPQGFADFVANQPVVVDPGRTHTGDPPPVTTDLSETDKALCKQTGLSEDDFKKTRQQELEEARA